MADRLLTIYRTHDETDLNSSGDTRLCNVYRTPSQAIDTTPANNRYLGLSVYDPIYGGLGIITGRVTDTSDTGSFRVSLFDYKSNILVRDILTDDAGFFVLLGLRTEFEWLVVAYSNSPSDTYDPVTDRIYLTNLKNTILSISGSAPEIDIVNLILTSPYENPLDNLLVLRSNPDIESVTGTLVAVEQTDIFIGDGSYQNPIATVIGTLVVTSISDTAAFAGTHTQIVSGTLEATSQDDLMVATGDGYTGLGIRRGTMAVIEQPDVVDFDGLWTMKWRATLEVIGQSDTVQGLGDFVPYQGPGFILATSPSDTASFTGANVYDVSGTMAAVETPDIIDFAVITNTQLDESSEDVLIASDVLTGDLLGERLVDLLYITDLLDYDRGMEFSNTLFATDVLSSGLKIAPLLADVGYLQDSITVLYGVSATDTLVVTEVLSSGLPLIAFDELQVTDLLSSYSSITGNLSDSAQSTDSITTVVSAVSVNTVQVLDTLSTVAEIKAVSADVVICADSLSSTIQVTQRLSDTAILTDAVDSAVLGVSSDSITCTDILVSTISQFVSASDIGTCADSLTGGITVYAPILADSVISTDVLSSDTILQLAGVLSDTALAGDSLFEAAQTVYVVNAETGAVSTYVFTPVINDFADYQGVLYLAGPDGLYALDADEDEDGAIVWTIRTGFSNLGTDLFKRIKDVNLQLRTEGDTTVQIVADRLGQKEEWNYRLPATTRESYRDGVVKIGQGIKSIYYAFGLQGIAPAEIDQLRVAVEPLSRRR